MCGYEHEYISYFSNSGVIDEEIYDRILQNIVAGKCPHVDAIPQELYKVGTRKGYFVKIVQMEWQTVKTLIRLLLYDPKFSARCLGKQ